MVLLPNNGLLAVQLENTCDLHCNIFTECLIMPESLAGSFELLPLVSTLWQLAGILLQMAGISTWLLVINGRKCDTRVGIYCAMYLLAFS